MKTSVRNADLAELAAMLKGQQARKLDVVVGRGQVHAQDGRLIIAGTEPVIGEDGVDMTWGSYLPTVVCDEGIADKLGIPVAYLKRLRTDHVSLYDQNVNGWLAPDERNFLIRCFRSNEGEGIARAFLSDRYNAIDNLDALTAALDGVRQAGVEVNITGCDLTDRRMYVFVRAPGVSVEAPELLDRYRAPNGDHGRDNSIIDAGFAITNSETGGGAFTIVPRVIVRVCKNGLTRTRDAVRAVHVGGKLDTGLIIWSDDTQRKNLDLIMARTRDAVATFLTADYLQKAVDELTAVAVTPIRSEAVGVVTKRLAFSQEQTQSVLDFFIQGADLTAGGVMQAITAYAQTVEDADQAFELEAQAIPAMEMAAAL